MISVIMPVHNTERYLHTSIDSVLNQTYQDFELIAIEDSSQDASGSILDDYAAKDTRVHVFHIVNKGISNARNFALERAQGDYIAFVDSDDWVAPDYLETLVSLTDGSRRDVVMCDATDVYPDRQQPSGLTTVLPATAQGTEILRIFLGRSGTLWNKLIGRDCIDGTRFSKNINYCEDILFLKEIAPRITGLKITSKPLYFYRRARAGSVVSGGLNAATMDLIYAMNIVYDALSNAEFRCEAVTRVRLCAGRVLKASADVPFAVSKPYRDALRPLLRKSSPYARELLKDTSKNRITRLIRCLEFKASCIAPNLIVSVYKVIRRRRKPKC